MESTPRFRAGYAVAAYYKLVFLLCVAAVTSANTRPS
jgi:hypothetical protein